MTLNLVENEVKPIYSCSQSDLYPLGIRMSGYCKTNIADFSNHSTSFTTTYCDDVKTMFIYAENLPDASIRSADHESKRIEIIPYAETCLNLAQKLKLHIEKAWSKEFWESKYKAAGFENYNKSAHENWNELTIMLTNMSNFINANSVALIAGGMPTTFETDFNTQLGDIRPLVRAFIDAENNAMTIRNTKITANNTAYTQLQVIAKTGKIIYSKDKSKRGLFTISKQLELISGAGSHWRNFEIDPDGFITVKKVVAHTYFINTGTVAVIVCEGDIKCTTGITVPAGETIRLDFENSTITVNNTSADTKAKFKVRCMKG